MHYTVQRLRQVTKPIAFQVFRWCVWAGVALLVFCIVTTGAVRALGFRAYGICFAAAVSGLLIHFAFITADEWRKRNYLTFGWMLLWTAFQGLIIYIGLRIAIFGFR
jgi:hypothetical protein